MTLDICDLYERVVKEREERGKKKGEGTQSQWRLDTIEDVKRQVLELDDEVWGVYNLNRECSWEHMTHVLVRIHLGDRRIPEEVWQYWLARFKEVVEMKKIAMDVE